MNIKSSSDARSELADSDATVAAPRQKRRAFPSTHVSELARAQRGERPALSALCQAYWYPVYCLIRSYGCPESTACDITQEFFVTLLTEPKNADPGSTRLSRYDPERQRFRSWLRKGARWFFLNWIARQNGNRVRCRRVVVTIDADVAEAQWQSDGMETVPPDQAYDRAWAQTVVRRARSRLEAHYADHQHSAIASELFERLADDGGVPDDDLCKQLGIKRGALRARRCRLKDDVEVLLGRYLQDEISVTVPSKNSIENEVSQLLEALGGAQ